MNNSDRTLPKSYLSLLDSLNLEMKMAAIAHLLKSVGSNAAGPFSLSHKTSQTSKKEQQENEEREDELFYKTFGAFPDDRSAEELIAYLKSARSFRTKALRF